MDRKIYDDGLAVRRAVGMWSRVRRSRACNADDSPVQLQEFVTTRTLLWGPPPQVMDATGLKRETRSMLNSPRWSPSA